MGTTGVREAIVKVGDIVEGRYRILKALGEGGMGTVFLAEHALIKRRVAIKILHQDLATDGDVIERFMNEARAAGTLGHPNIVESTDMGFTANHVPYIVFEYLEGTLLTDEIYRVNGMPARRVVKIAAQIASALTAAHKAGIIHRDLKSDNVFLTDKDDLLDHVKVLDFGISRFLESDHSHHDGTVMGTPEFMAPEQITAPHTVDQRADIYALGVMMYEMLEARRPFSNENDPQSLLNRIVHDVAPPLTRSEIPHGLADLIMTRMLAKQPHERFSTMNDVEAALEQYVTRDGTPLPRRRTQPAIATTETDVARYSTTIPRPAQGAQTPWPGQMVTMAPARRPYALYGIAAGGLLLGAIGLVFGLRGGGASDPVAQQPAAAAPQPAVAKKIAVKLDADVDNARVVFRRRMQAAPTGIEIAPSDVVELVEVSAPGYKTVRYWLTFDRETHLKAHLEPGDGAMEASEEQTLVALGELAAVPAPVAVAAPVAPAPAVAAVEPVKQEVTIEKPAVVAKAEPKPRPAVEAKPAEARMAPRKIGRSAEPPPPEPVAAVEVAPVVEEAKPATVVAEQAAAATTTAEVPAVPAVEQPKTEPAPVPVAPADPPKVAKVEPKKPAVAKAPAVVSAKAVNKLSGAAPNITVNHYEGADLPQTIAVKLCIDASGHVASATLISKLDSSLASEITGTMGKWVYSPYLVNGTATPVCFPVGLRTR